MQIRSYQECLKLIKVSRSRNSFGLFTLTEGKSLDSKELVFRKTYCSAITFRCEKSGVDCVRKVENRV
jgi:hypothetical protein